MDRADAELYEKHGDELIRFATVLVGPACAEDVLTDAVLRAFASPGWPQVADRRAYLFRVVLNQARQQHRADRRRQVRETSAIRGGVVPGIPTARSEVMAAMSRLTHRQRAVVFLTYWQGLEAAEAAALLHVSTRTVQRQLAVARRRLEALLR
jgi:RNA polymerase sigma-70 factor (ECF subfamily)